MKRRALAIFLIANVLVLGLILGGTGGLLYLAEVAPFSRASPFHPVQRLVESVRLGLARDPARQATFALTLTERRLADLAQAETPDAMVAATHAFSLALDEAIRLVAAASQETGEALSPRLTRLLKQADIVLASVSAQTQSPTVAQVLQKVEGLLTVDHLADRVALVPPRPEGTLLTHVAIPFLGENVDHSFYPLEGGHSGVPCAKCHTNGTYTGTATDCAGCHAAGPIALKNRLAYPLLVDEQRLLAEAMYPDHFPGACADCHNVVSWRPYDFDHVGVVECLTCHLDDRPTEDHYVQTASRVSRLASLMRSRALSPEEQYPGRCVNCHPQPADWTVLTFDHKGFEDCARCHLANDAPKDHYVGQCSRCHSTADWAQVSFDHRGFTDCAACHSASGAHYPGYCGSCHSVSRWDLVSYDHLGVETCLECHAENAPADHYAGDCWLCHTTADWKKVTFNHLGLGDCASCHSRADHYGGQCSDCHTTSGWLPASFNHGGFSDCAGCHWHKAPAGHYPGQCSNCHQTGRWDQVTFSHTGLAACASCHAGEAPGIHYGDDCANCHNTLRWTDTEALPGCEGCHSPPSDHTYPIACESCHTGDHPTPSWQVPDYVHDAFVDCGSCHAAPAGHWAGQCSTCHSGSWLVADYDHVGAWDCLSCHPTPTGHWPGQCSSCHTSTDTWTEITFDHTTYTRCNACHRRPSGHPRGQCSNCHTTDTWAIPTTPTPTPTATATPPPSPPTPTPTPTETPSPPPPPTPTPTEVPPTEEPPEDAGGVDTPSPTATPLPSTLPEAPIVSPERPLEPIEPLPLPPPGIYVPE